MPALSMHVVVVVDVAMRLVCFEDEPYEDGSLLLSVACASASFICLPRIFALTYSKMGSVYMLTGGHTGRTLRMCMAARSTPNSLLFLYCSSDSSRSPHASSTAARLNAISPSSGARDDATL